MMLDEKHDRLKPVLAHGVAARFLRFPLTKIIIGAVVCLLASQAVNVTLKYFLGQTHLDQDWAKMIRVILNCGAMFGAYYWLFKLYEKRKISELKVKHLLKEGVFGFLAGGLAISLVIFTLFIIKYYEPVSINGSLFVQLYSFTIIATMAAAEEILLRGILYRITETSLGTPIALVISGLVFSLIHLRNANSSAVSVVSITLGGIVTGLAFSSTRRLWYPIFIHAGWNYAQAFYGTILSGMGEYASYGFIRSKLHGPELLTGGAFGPENSLITILVLLILSVWMYSRTRKKGNMIAPFWSRERRVRAKASADLSR